MLRVSTVRLVLPAARAALATRFPLRAQARARPAVPVKSRARLPVALLALWVSGQMEQCARIVLLVLPALLAPVRRKWRVLQEHIRPAALAIASVVPLAELALPPLLDVPARTPRSTLALSVRTRRRTLRCVRPAHP